MRLLALALLLIVPGMLRQVARVAVSWSTVVLSGEVPRTREPHLVVMGVGCLAWYVMVPPVVTVAEVQRLFAEAWYDDGIVSMDEEQPIPSATR